HLAVQATAQRYIDSSISKTINCPETMSFDAFKDVYRMAYEDGCKGCTTYRPNPVTGAVLETERGEEPVSSLTPEILSPEAIAAHALPVTLPIAASATPPVPRLTERGEPGSVFYMM